MSPGILRGIGTITPFIGIPGARFTGTLIMDIITICTIIITGITAPGIIIAATITTTFITAESVLIRQE